MLLWVLCSSGLDAFVIFYLGEPATDLSLEILGRVFVGSRALAVAPIATVSKEMVVRTDLFSLPHRHVSQVLQELGKMVRVAEFPFAVLVVVLGWLVLLFRFLLVSVILAWVAVTFVVSRWSVA